MAYLRLKFLLTVISDFTMWVFTWGLANDHDKQKKYDKIGKHTTMFNLI